MADVIIKMNGSVTGATTNDIATIDVQNTGFIEAILASTIVAGADADGDSAQAELTFASSNSFGVNDVRSSIMMVKSSQNLLTSGGGNMGQNLWVAPPGGIPVVAGERIHLHGSASTGVSLTVDLFLYLISTTRGRIPTRRR